MPVTVGGTTITFNDGSTQSSAASGYPTPAAGTLLINTSPLNNGFSVNSTSYTLSQYGVYFYKGGVIRTKIRVFGFDNSYYGGPQVSSIGRIYINGVAVGTEVSSIGTAVLQQDFTVATGDFLQFANRASNTQGPGVSINAWFGVANLAQLDAMVFAGPTTLPF